MPDDVTTPVPPPAPDIQDTSAPPLMPTSQPQPPPAPPIATGPAQAPASAGTSSPAPGGVLGNIALGALGGANSALNNNPPAAPSNHRGIISAIGNGLKTIAKNTPWGLQIQNIHQKQQIRQQDLADKKQAAQIAQQKAQQEAVKAIDEHTESNIRATSMTTDNLHKAHEYAHLESLYAGEEEAARMVHMDQTRTEMAADAEEWENLAAAGVPIDVLHGAGFDGMTPENAQQAGSGATVGILNGKPEADMTMGFVNKALLQNTPLPKDTPIISDFSLDQKTGTITPIRTPLAAGHNTLWDAKITYGAAAKKFHQLQDIWDTSQKNKAAEDTDKKTLAETADEYAKAENQRAQAVQAGGGINDQNRNLTGEPFVKTLPPQQQDLVRGIGHYQSDFKDLPRGKEKLPIMAAVEHAYGPDGWSEAKYELRKNYLNEYGTSTRGDGATRNRINTAIGHLDMLGKASEALAQNNLPYINQIANSMGVPMGQSAKLVTDAIAEKAAGEVSGAIKGGGNSPTDPAIDKALKGLAVANMNPQQRADVLRAQFGLLNTQVGTIAGKFKSTMGQSPEEFGQPVLYGDSQKTLDRWTSSSGGTPQTAKIGGQEYPIQADGTIVVSGHTYKLGADGRTLNLVAPSTGGASSSW